ncbi:MAG TPA: transporter [Methylomirabilota bacterium]|nr:transporter [Methylomirabilota bacterium]
MAAARGVTAGPRISRAAGRAARLLVVIVLLAIASVGVAEEIQPDRPELTESARLVPRGAVQLEAGMALSQERRAATATEKRVESETDLRIGVADDVELNLGWEPLVRVRGPDDATGIGDVMLGIRYRFVRGTEEQSWPPHVALKLFTRLPAAEQPIGTGRPDFGALLLASFELPQDFELEVNVGGAAIGQMRGGGFLGEAITTASLSRELAPSLLGFVELLLNSRTERDGRGQVAINTGIVYRVMPNLAVDAGLQTSLAGQGPDYVVRTGVSVLWR